MTDTITLATMRTNVRQRADMVSSLFVTDAEVNGYIQESYKELYDLITEAYEDYNLSNSSFTISSGNTASLPATLYKIRGLDDMSDASNPRTVRRYMFHERNDYGLADRLSLSSDYSDVLYTTSGSTLYIVPSDRAARAYRIWFVPLPTVPAIDSDTIDAINGWAEYITIDAAIKCKIKEESDTAALERAKKNAYERITRMRSNRDQNLPAKVSRVRNRRYADAYRYPGDPIS